MTALLLLAAAAAAEFTAPVVSTEPIVEVSNASISSLTGGAEPAPKPKHRIRAVIHAEAKDWEPITLKAGGDPESIRTGATLLLIKAKGKYKGTPTKTKASAALHKGQNESWLVISLFPQALERRRTHLEVRFRLFEGYIENVQAAAVTAEGNGTGMDSFDLRAAGVSFGEAFPTVGKIQLAALDPRPSKSALNAGTLKLAAFADKDLGWLDLAWSVRGLR